MKKLLSITALALASLWLTPATSSASGTFGLCIHKGCCKFKCCGKGCSTICIKPYNAFSPTMSGSMCFDGGCPFGFPGQGNVPGFQLNGVPCGPGCAMGQPWSLPASPIEMPGALTNPTQPVQAAPLPMPANISSGIYQNAAPSYGPMQVGYYPVYYPANQYVPSMPVSYYWNNNGR